MQRLLLRGIHLANIKGVLFDKDGTLSNSESHLIDLAHLRINEAIRHLTERNEPKERIFDVKKLLHLTYGIKSTGLSPTGLLAIASRKDNLIATATVLSLTGDDWPKAIELAEEIFLRVDNLQKDSPSESKERELLPGAKDVLKKLQAAGITCALISNDTTKGIQEFLFKNNLENLVQGFWSSENEPPKPNPGAIKGLCNQIRLHPSDCALVGDADSDLRMASRAGIEIAIGYVSGWTNPPNLCQSEHIIQHWDELSVEQNPTFPGKIGSP